MKSEYIEYEVRLLVRGFLKKSSLLRKGRCTRSNRDI